MDNHNKKDIYFIFDESIINNKIGIISCVVFEDKEVFEQVQTILDHIRHKPGFGPLKSSYPHYCDDDYTQIQFILEELRYINFKSYLVFKEYDNISDTKIVQKELLGDFAKPLHMKYKNRHGKNANFHFLFENLTPKFMRDKELYSKCLQNSSMDLGNIYIEILAKGDRNSISFLPDYICGGLKAFLTLKRGEKNTLGDRIFSQIMNGNGIGSIKFFDKNGDVKNFHTSNQIDRVSFMKEFRGMFMIEK